MSQRREPAPSGDGDQTPTPSAAGTAAATGTAVKAPEGPVVVSPSVYRRLVSGLPGLIVAMLVCLLAGLVILLMPRRNDNAIPRADYRSDLTGLVATAPYQVLAPEGLPPQWYPTSTRLTGRVGGPVSWHLGFNTPGKEYAALEESNETPDGAGNFVDRMTSQGHPDGTAQIAGATWDRRFRPDKKQRSLVRELPGVTIVLTGTASYEELAVLAGSLKPQPKTASGATPVR